MKIHAIHQPIVDALNLDEVSEEIIMASAAGWYLGSVQLIDMPRICSGGVLAPYARHTDYMSKEQAEKYYEYNQEDERAADREDKAV